MMKVECGWCKADLGWVTGPDGETSHGICKPCQEKQMRSCLTVGQKLLAVVAFAALLLLYGIAGECDRQDAVQAEQLRGEIVASAQSWAVRR